MADLLISPSPIDLGMHCPMCDCDLTGLTKLEEHVRCPECGNAYTLQQIRDLPLPIPYWQSNVPSPVLRFLYACLATWFAPRKFALAFPRRYSFGQAAAFRWITLAIAFLVQLRASSDESGAMYAALLAFEVPFFELILVGCCHAFLRPATQRKDRAQYVCPPDHGPG